MTSVEAPKLRMYPKQVESQVAEDMREKVATHSDKDAYILALLLEHVWRYPQKLKKWADQTKD